MDDEFEGGPQQPAGRARQVLEETVDLLARCTLPEGDGDWSWSGWIAQQATDGCLPPLSNELRELMVAVEEVAEERQELGRFISQLAPIGADIAAAESGGVRFMSMSKSKGLTSQATIVVGVEQDLIPRKGEDPREERRLVYVAMTRPTEHLYLTYARRRFGQQQRVNQGEPGLRNPTVLLDGTSVGPTDGATFLAGLDA